MNKPKIPKEKSVKTATRKNKEVKMEKDLNTEKNKETSEKFSYTYSAPTEKERKQIESIRRSYLPQTDSDFAKLKRLDSKIKNPPRIAGITLGVVGTLTFGGGLTLIQLKNEIVAGTILMLVGLAIVLIAYPVKEIWLKRNKKKHKDEILALADELLENDEKSKE